MFDMIPWSSMLPMGLITLAFCLLLMMLRSGRQSLSALSLVFVCVSLATGLVLRDAPEVIEVQVVLWLTHLCSLLGLLVVSISLMVRVWGSAMVSHHEPHSTDEE
jgi:hypothetical protein